MVMPFDWEIAKQKELLGLQKLFSKGPIHRHSEGVKILS
ncbi:Uncharacterised protein [Porphyromonas crevioricanis]|uniref:Uncharacterized protein n=1 Tax=Porphyromonas crevioricanis TaxID=393921 RepID=A0A2X4Q098_9PORP|nr:hypothetical protein PORCAN_525 [Porphyromonas crevioricanis JCM 13913]SQH73517.1 Uncharacterised protein [Porphyromonas crevioricanis]